MPRNPEEDRLSPEEREDRERQLTLAPTPGQPLSEADVSLLQPGDWLPGDWLLPNSEQVDAQLPSHPVRAVRTDETRVQVGTCVWFLKSRFTFLGRPDQDGWIAWSGGENPVPGVRVDVRFRDGEIRLNDQHSDKRWRHDPTIFLRFHIAAYRPHAPVSRPAGEGEREAVARIIDPVRWRRFDRHPHYADHIPRETQIEWSAALQDSLTKADAILAAISTPAQASGEAGSMVCGYCRATVPGGPAEMRQHVATRHGPNDDPEADIARVAAHHAHPPAQGSESGALASIAAERRRQVDVEGWTSEHDDEHDDYSLGLAAASYAGGVDCGSKVVSYTDDVSGGRGDAPVWGARKKRVPTPWPASWDPRWWKPTGDRRRDLVKAGALIVAEIERLDRAALQPGGER